MQEYEGEKPALPGIAYVAVPRSHNALHKHAEHFLHKSDFQVSRISRPGRQLSASSPRLNSVKACVAQIVESGKAHPLLIGKFDQVWTTVYESAACVTWKDSSRESETIDLALDDGKWFRRRKLARQLRAQLGLEKEALGISVCKAAR